MRFEGGQLFLDGYPDGSKVHGIKGAAADELKRLAIFQFELDRVQRWLAKVHQCVLGTVQDDDVAVGLSDAALLGFCRCFDFDHPFKPLKPKKVFTPQQRADFDRLKNIRNWKVGHDKQLTNGTYSLLVIDKDTDAIEAVSVGLQVPFFGMQEIEVLVAMSQVALAWVRQEYERVGDRIVQAHNDSPKSERRLESEFSITILEQDFFKPKADRQLPKKKA